MLRRSLGVLICFLLGLSTWGKDPAIVLISLDTFRADRLAPWGGRPDLAPNLNALAERGSAFTGCWTPAPITLTAHATLLTGFMPARTGLHDNGMGVLAKDVPTLAEALSKRGYDTRAIVASALLASRFGLARGFSQYDGGVGPARVRSATQVTDRAIAAVKAAGDRPFFVFAHYYDTHEPYAAPEAFAHRFSGSAYDAAVAYVDSEVGRLLKGLPAGTLVLVVSDHGEALGEHGEPTHGSLLHVPTLRTVLILAGPGVEKGRTVSSPCTLADVAPTLLNLVGAASPAYTCEGRDLLLGKSAATPRILLLETWLPFDQFRWCPLTGVTDGRFEWVRGRRDALYDLKDDPGESRDISASPPEQALKLRAALPRLPAEPPVAGPVDEAIKGLGYAPVPGGTLKGKELPDPRDQTGILQLMGRARLDRATGNVERAAQLYGSAAEKDPGNPSALFEFGETLRQRGRNQEALAVLDRAIAVAPVMAEAWTAKGHALVGLQKPAEAVPCYEKALALSPDSADALNPLAAYYLDQNKPDKAFPLLNKAEGEGFANSDTYLMQGRIHLVQNKKEEALKDFFTAMQLTENAPKTLKAEADIFMVRGMYNEAVKLYEQGIRLDPMFAPNYLTLGTFYLNAERPELALPLFRKALDCDLDKSTRENVQEIVAELEKASGPESK